MSPRATHPDLDLLSQHKQAAQRVRDELDAQRRNLAETAGDIEALQTALLPVADAIARIPSVIAYFADRDRDRHHQHVQHHLAAPSAAPTHALHQYGASDALVSWPGLCRFAPEIASAMLRRAIEEREYTAGPPAAQRPALLEQLTRKLAALEAKEEQFVDELVAMGLNVAHRPAVQDRRANDARIARERAAAEEDHARRQAAIDSRTVASALNKVSSGRGESEYLKSQRAPW